MLEEGGLPSVWTSLLSWFTPAVFFVLLNLVIGTIALTSKARSSPKSTPSPGDYGRANTLVRAPSLVLDRLRSFNLSQYVHHHYDYDNNLPTDNTTVPLAAGADTAAAANGNGNALTRAPSLVLSRLRSFGLSRFVSGDLSAETLHVEPAVDAVLDSASQVEEHELYNEHHIERTQSDTKPPLAKLPVRMKKSASDKSAFSHFEEDEIPKQQTIEEEDGEVDAKADDFINKFKNQLRLQRLDSIMRYKEMLTRGAAS